MKEPNSRTKKDSAPTKSLPVVESAREVDGGERRRARTIPARRLTREELRVGEDLRQTVQYRRPEFRSECREGRRPCPFVSCKYNLYLDVNPVTGSIKLNFPDKEVWELEDTCALDVAERGGATLEEVGFIMNLTRERIRQVENTGLGKIKAGVDDLPLEDLLEP